LVLRIVTNQSGRRADFALDADFPLLGVIFIQSIAQPIGHRVADDHYCLARRRFQFTRRRRLRVIDGWRWTIAALAGERRQKIAVGRAAIIATGGIGPPRPARGAPPPPQPPPAAGGATAQVWG